MKSLTFSERKENTALGRTFKTRAKTMSVDTFRIVWCISILLIAVAITSSGKNILIMLILSPKFFDFELAFV